MEQEEKPSWVVTLSSSAEKQNKKLPAAIQAQLFFLVKEMQVLGPHRITWKNYSPLRKGGDIPENAFHCHLKKGKPTYVACWKVDKKDKKIEVYYVGTHENAPY